MCAFDTEESRSECAGGRTPFQFIRLTERLKTPIFAGVAIFESLCQKFSKSGTGPKPPTFRSCGLLTILNQFEDRRRVVLRWATTRTSRWFGQERRNGTSARPPTAAFQWNANPRARRQRQGQTRERAISQT